MPSAGAFLYFFSPPGAHDTKPYPSREQHEFSWDCIILLCAVVLVVHSLKGNGQHSAEHVGNILVAL
jgi:hypothetical protein